MNINSKGFTNIILVVVIVILLGTVGYFAFVKKSEPIAQQSTSTQIINPTKTPITTLTPVTQQNLNSIFELSKKEAGTKIYYSEKLGVGFTYLSPSANYTPKITESASKINLDGQTIEVFTKDPKLTLAEVIKSKFLQGYNSNDCFVKTYETSEQKLSTYVSAGISFPPTNDPDAPWWQNSDKCPQHYSETNGVQYFLMNKDVPGKFLFVRIGQDSAASDGTPLTADGGFNWSHSIRILK